MLQFQIVFIYLVCVCVGILVCFNKHVEIRSQPTGVSFLPPPRLLEIHSGH